MSNSPAGNRRHASSEERIAEDDERSEDAQEPQPGHSLPSRQAAALPMVMSPETPQVDNSFLRARHADVGTMCMQTPAGAVHADMHEGAVSPGTAAAKSAQRLFLASVLQGAQIPIRQVKQPRLV